MVDDKIIEDKNQLGQEELPSSVQINPEHPKPIFESVPVEDATPLSSETIKPEEVAPDVATPIPEEIANSESPPPPDVPPPVYEENKSKYYLIVGGTVLFFLLLIFFLKTLVGGTKPKETKLLYWGLWEDEAVLAPLISQYEQQNPHVKIEYQKMAPQDYREKLLARSKNGQGPDIFRFHNTWLPEIKEVVAPLPDSVMTNREFENTFYKVHQKDLKVDNHYYGLPLMIDGLVLICNDNLFKKAGISKAPLTWDELTDTVTKLTVKDRDGKLITAGIALGTASNIEHFSDILGLMLVQNGSNLKELDQMDAAGALESYRKFAEPPHSFWDENMPNSLTAFIQEKVAMIFAPSWEILVIKSANPDINLKVVPVPSVPGAASVSIANYWVEGVSRFSRSQIEAWKFLRFLTEKDNLTKLYELQSKTRLFGEPYSRVDLAPLLVQNEYIGAVIKQADYFVSLPLISRTFDNGLNDEIIQYLENAVNATVQGVSYNEALGTAKLGVDQVFSKYKVEEKL